MKFFLQLLNRKPLRLIVLTGALGMASFVFAADPGRIVLQIDKPGAEISPLFYGLMTEEINYSYEGGLYGELIQNRIFKDPPGGGVLPPAAGTTEPGLFRSEHYSMRAFSCKVPNGKYIAKLYFA